MSETHQAVRRILGALKYPNLPKTLDELGLIDIIDANPEGLTVALKLLSPAPTTRRQLLEACQKALADSGFSKVQLDTHLAVPQANVPGKSPLPGIRQVLAVASGKGGVGKSTVAHNLAVALQQQGARVGLLDCDIYGPSVPSLIGNYQPAQSRDDKLVPIEKDGLRCMSMGFLVARNRPVSWRGPMLHKVLMQMLYQTNWGELDYLLLDLPPGTGDVQLTVTGQAPISGALLVTTPQKIALADVRKGLAMFHEVQIPIMGLIENMSYFLCPNCDRRHAIFRSGGGARIADMAGVALLGELPLSEKVPSPLGQGSAVLARAPESQEAEAFHQLADQVAMAAEKTALGWATPGPGALEV